MQSKISTASCELLPFEIAYLPELYVKKAAEEINDTPKVRDESIKQMRDALEADEQVSKQSQLDSDDRLLQFLRSRKFDIPRSVSAYRSYFNFRRKYTERYTNVRFETLRKCVDNKVINFLPFRCQDGCAIILAELGIWNPVDIPFEDLERMAVLCYEQALQYPMTQVNGFKIIFDGKDCAITHMRYLTPYMVYLQCHYVQECLPARIKSLHFINEPYFVKVIWRILKMFLSIKMRSRVHIHDNSKELLDFFPKQVLPSKYGGDLNDYGDLEWLRTVTSQENLEKLYGKDT